MGYAYVRLLKFKIHHEILLTDLILIKVVSMNYRGTLTNCRILCLSVSGVKSFDNGMGHLFLHSTARESPALAMYSLPRMNNATNAVHPPVTLYFCLSSPIN